MTSAAVLAAAPFSAGAGQADDELARWFLPPEGGLAGSRVIHPAPERLVERGKIRVGLFASPPAEADLLEADLFQDGIRAGWRRKRLMEWFGYGLIHPDWYLGMIIIDAKLLPIAAVYAVNRRDRTVFSHDLTGGRVKVAANPWRGRTGARGPGFKAEFVHLLAEGRHEIKLELERPRRPKLRGELVFYEDLERWPALVASLPTNAPHFFYTHKSFMTASGSLVIGDEKIHFDPGRDLANLDEHRNYADFPVRWTWGSGGGDDGGGLLAFNLGDTGGSDQERWNENCLWIGDRLELLGPVSWSHDLRDPRKPWTVTELHGRVKLEFTPDNGKVVSLPPLGGYYQMAGSYRGFVVDRAGARHEVRGLPGCAENGAVGG